MSGWATQPGTFPGMGPQRAYGLPALGVRRAPAAEYVPGEEFRSTPAPPYFVSGQHLVSRSPVPAGIRANFPIQASAVPGGLAGLFGLGASPRPVSSFVRHMRLGDAGDPTVMAAQALGAAIDQAIAGSTALDLTNFHMYYAGVSDPVQKNALAVASATANKGVDEVRDAGPYSSAATGNDPADVQAAGAADVQAARTMIAQLLTGQTTGGALPQASAFATAEEKARTQAQVDAQKQSVVAAWFQGAGEGAKAEASSIGSAVKNAVASVIPSVPWYVKLGVALAVVGVAWRQVRKVV